MIIKEKYNLKQHNTFGLDAVAQKYVEYSSESELIEILNSGLINKEGVLHIGEGSNLLFTRDEIGVVLHSKICSIDIKKEDDERVEIAVGGGVKWDDLCAWAVERGFWGIENLSHIPGEVGAAAVQNIGAYGVEVCDVIREVRVVAINEVAVKIYYVDDCEYGYRTSIFKGSKRGEYIVTKVLISLSKKENRRLDYSGLRSCFEENGNPTLKEIREEIIKTRDGKLPDVSVLGSAGSFFKNPVISGDEFRKLLALNEEIPHYKNTDMTIKVPAGWLIEKSGMKGYEHKGARVYEKQALVIVNGGEAKGSDIVELSQKVQAEVQAKFGIYLEPEVQFI